MMNQDVKMLWVDALRSGEYKQGTFQLRNQEDEFCCLGVLCEISGMPYNGNHSYLTDGVLQWSGLTHDFGDQVKIYGKTELLSTHNDRGRTFEEIAKAIEEQL